MIQLIVFRITTLYHQRKYSTLHLTTEESDDGCEYEGAEYMFNISNDEINNEE